MRDYKRNELNPYLHDDSLKRKDAKDISIAAMERDFSEHHKNVEKEQVAIRSQQLRQELNEIDTLLNRLDSIIKKDD